MIQESDFFDIAGREPTFARSKRGSGWKIAGFGDQGKKRGSYEEYIGTNP